MKNNIKYLTEAALMTGIVSAFMLLSYYLGGTLESICFFLLPIPLVIYSKRYGFKKGLIPLIAIFLISLLLNPLNGLCYILPACIVGIIYGSFLYNKSYGTRLTLCMFASFTVNIITMLFLADLFDYDILEEIKILADTFIKIFHIHVDPQNYNLLLYNLIPAFIFIIATLEGFLINYASSFILYRLREVPTFSVDIFKFKVPRFLSIIYIALTVIFFTTLRIYPDSEGIVFYLLTLNSNLFFIISFLLIIQGLLWIEIMLLQRFRNKTIWFMIGITALIIIFPPLLVIAAFFGFVSSLLKSY